MGFTNDATNVIAEVQAGATTITPSQWVWSPLPLTGRCSGHATGLRRSEPASWNEIPVGVPATRTSTACAHRRSSPRPAASGHLVGCGGDRTDRCGDQPGPPGQRHPLDRPLGRLAVRPTRSPRAPATRPIWWWSTTAELGITLDVGLYKSAGNAPVKVHAVKSIFIFPGRAARRTSTDPSRSGPTASSR